MPWKPLTLDCEFILWGLLVSKVLLHLLFAENVQGNLPSSHIIANYVLVMSVLSVLVADGKQRHLLDSFLKKRKKIPFILLGRQHFMNKI